MVVKKILIVDDHPRMRQMIRLVVESQHGLTVCGEATDGLDAVGKTLELKPDLIVLDFQMPGMNGVDAARAIHGRFSDLPIILFTLHEDSLPEFAIRDTGITVLSKMDGISSLAARLQRLLHSP